MKRRSASIARSLSLSLESYLRDYSLHRAAGITQLILARARDGCSLPISFRATRLLVYPGPSWCLMSVPNNNFVLSTRFLGSELIFRRRRLRQPTGDSERAEKDARLPLGISRDINQQVRKRETDVDYLEYAGITQPVSSRVSRFRASLPFSLARARVRVGGFIRSRIPLTRVLLKNLIFSNGCSLPPPIPSQFFRRRVRAFGGIRVNY